MVNQKATTDLGGESRVAKGEELEIRHLAETMHIPPELARTLLRRHGNDWAKIREEAERLKGHG